MSNPNGYRAIGHRTGRTENITTQRGYRYAGQHATTHPNVCGKRKRVSATGAANPAQCTRVAIETTGMSQKKGNEGLMERHHGYFLGEEAMHESNTVELLERGEWVTLPPTLVVHGTADDVMPIESAERFVSLYNAAGGRPILSGSRGWLTASPTLLLGLDSSPIPRQRLNTHGNIYNMMRATFTSFTCPHPNFIHLESGLAQPSGKRWLSNRGPYGQYAFRS